METTETTLWRASAKLLEIERLKSDMDKNSSQIIGLMDDLLSQEIVRALASAPHVRAWMRQLCAELADHYTRQLNHA
jgi:hypothetical protein